MAHFFYNTDADSLVRQGRFPVLLQHGIAATSGPSSFGEQLGQLAPGDVLLMYENRVGVVAVGTVTGWWDRATHRPPIYYQPGDDGFDHEYRISVSWWLDLSGCPVGLEDLRDRVGYTPRGTITRIASRQAEVEQLIDERRASLAPQPHPPNNKFGRAGGREDGEVMNQTGLFALLGAPLVNSRWSWGAIRHEDGVVFLRVWQDRMRERDGSQFVQVTNHGRHGAASSNPGYRERVRHVNLILGGATCYLVVCEAVDPAARPRQVRRFNNAEVFPGGRVEEVDGEWWVEVMPGVPIGEVASAAAAPEEVSVAEGRELLRLHRTRERNRGLVARKKRSVLSEFGRLACEACGFDFAAVYGSRGDGFAECHHTQPISRSIPDRRTRLSELAVVCANCHRMLHCRPWVSVSDLQALLRARRGG